MSQGIEHGALQERDRRIRRTQLLIRDAFMALLIERGFDKVTVQSIAERANINRATFYRHYRDKFDLAEQFTKILFADVTAQLESDTNRNSTERWQILFEHVAQYALFYRTMLGRGGIPGFADLVRATVEEQLTAQLPQMGFSVERLQMPLPLPIRYLAAAQMGLIQWWLENEMPFSPAQAADYLIKLHLYGASWALGLTGEEILHHGGNEHESD